jgi:hypothetical protein
LNKARSVLIVIAEWQYGELKLIRLEMAVCFARFGKLGA